MEMETGRKRGAERNKETPWLSQRDLVPVYRFQELP